MKCIHGHEFFLSARSWYLTDRQSSECLKQLVDQAFRILTSCPETDGARADLARNVIPLALD
jgi:hypothetical protein